MVVQEEGQIRGKKPENMPINISKTVRELSELEHKN